MVVLVSCKNEDNSSVRDGILTKFELIQVFMTVFVICKNEEIHPKMKALEWSQHVSHYKSMRIFPDA